MLAYHRPATLEEALSLLQTDGRVILAGGTMLNAGSAARSAEAVDLQALDLAGVTPTGDTVVIGAMTRLADLAEHEAVPEVLRRLARAELPSTLRSMATVGGTVVAGSPDSALLAGLLVYHAEVTVTSTAGDSVLPLADVNPAALEGSIITSVEVAADGTAAVARTGRTPADTPIVAVVGRRGEDGQVRLAATGVDAAPLLLDPADPTQGLQPAADFRGSDRYRRHLVAVLADRVLSEIG